MDKPADGRGSTGPTDGIKAEGDAGNERHICKANPATTDDIGKKHGMEDASEKFFRREICFGTESSYQIP
ncbi:hypothetical protein SHY38_07555 [Bifidobacterium breve]|nr:hypothetical protein [Bifidobacterium breve]MDX5146738.1 hypothetical protein [Bifidobacterium breve]